MERRDIVLALALVALLCTTNAFAQTAANPLLAIDQHRTTVVERVVNEWETSSRQGATIGSESRRIAHWLARCAGTFAHQRGDS
jgi:hypothetical protein